MRHLTPHVSDFWQKRKATSAITRWPPPCLKVMFILIFVLYQRLLMNTWYKWLILVLVYIHFSIFRRLDTKAFMFRWLHQVMFFKDMLLLCNSVHYYIDSRFSQHSIVYPVHWPCSDFIVIMVQLFTLLQMVRYLICYHCWLLLQVGIELYQVA